MGTLVVAFVGAFVVPLMRTLVWVKSFCGSRALCLSDLREQKSSRP